MARQGMAWHDIAMTRHDALLCTTMGEEAALPLDCSSANDVQRRGGRVLSVSTRLHKTYIKISYHATA